MSDNTERRELVSGELAGVPVSIVQEATPTGGRQIVYTVHGVAVSREHFIAVTKFATCLAEVGIQAWVADIAASLRART